MVANSADFHDQPTDQGTTDTGIESSVNLNVGCPVMLDVHVQLCFVSFISCLISIHSFVTVENWTSVHITFLTGNVLRIKFLKH
jgi:hypothetical protein